MIVLRLWNVLIKLELDKLSVKFKVPYKGFAEMGILSCGMDRLDADQWCVNPPSACTVDSFPSNELQDWEFNVG